MNVTYVYIDKQPRIPLDYKSSRQTLSSARFISIKTFCFFKFEKWLSLIKSAYGGINWILMVIQT
jgi:hypothetical protein